MARVGEGPENRATLYSKSQVQCDRLLSPIIDIKRRGEEGGQSFQGKKDKIVTTGLLTLPYSTLMPSTLVSCSAVDKGATPEGMV